MPRRIAAMARRSKLKEDRTRTFTGCRTCRRRHAKCDEGVPDCGVCRRLGLNCGGYAPSLSWIIDEATVPTHRSQPCRIPDYRFQLFSEVERRELSKELARSTGFGTAIDRLLGEIDLAYEKLDGCTKKDASGVVKGPFGVFGAMPAVSDTSAASLASSSSPPASFSEAPTTQELAEPWIEPVAVTDSFVPGTESAFDLFATTFTANLFPFPLHDNPHLVDQFMVMDPALSTTLPDFVQHFDYLNPPDLEFGALPLPDLSSYVDQDDETAGCTEDGQDLNRDRRELPSRAHTPSRDMSNIPEHAASLLRFYKKYLEKTTTQIQAKRRSPWQVLFLPCALETYSEITLWNKTSHTRSSILSTLVAKSAFLLHISEGASGVESRWREVGLRHLRSAQTQLKAALQNEVHQPKRTNYKEILMAILALAVTSLYHDTNTFKIYLLDAERLIRLFGFDDYEVGSEIRILHHMYAHLRVIAESISLVAKDKGYTDESDNESMRNTRAFHIREDSLNVGLDGALVKPHELGLTDIHLESQGRWSQTLFPLIYGIPESLMTLLSQTVSISNVKSFLESQALRNPKTHIALSHHIKSLERTIWSFSLEQEMSEKNSSREQSESDTHEELLDHHLAQSMTRAIHQALILYFYRRVHNVSAYLLQDTVLRSLEHLEVCIDDLINDQDFSFTLAWPAFITACEAVSCQDQERSLSILQKIDKCGFSFTPQPLKDIVTAVWTRRKETGDMTISWMSVMTGKVPEKDDAASVGS